MGGLLDFARQNKVNRTRVEIRALIEEAVQIVRAGRDDAVSYPIECAPDMPAASVDHDQMLQVLTNVIRNAADVMPQGGKVAVHAWRAPAQGDLHIAVRDSGPGIPAEAADKLFTPFFTTKPIGRGTGLGLPICYGIVKMHRGTIAASNNDDGPGATFEICIPEAADDAGNGGEAH